jgi:hypothetical protein
MLPTLNTSVLLPDHALPVLAQGLEDKSSSGGASLTMAATPVAREEEDGSWLFQELEAMACMLDFLSNAFPNLES